jgi:hypothetical protein
MALGFPNLNRFYDVKMGAIRFWGHDGAMEASFFVNEDALRKIQPDIGADGDGLLRAFDSNRDLICAAAAKVYQRGRKGSYDLVPGDF